MMTPSKTLSPTKKRSSERLRSYTKPHSLFGAVLRKCFLSQSDYDATSEPALKPLKSYRYSGVDRSFISRYILTPYWNACVKQFPIWMAPNLITFIGFILMLSTLVVLVVHDPHLINMSPSWTYIYYSISLWIYSTLDNVDGKQARRTNSSSPLGELFDHGCDSLNAMIIAILQAAAFGIGHSYLYFVTLFFALWGFYLPTWEEYHTGVLYLGYVNGPTEGLLVACTTLLISGIYGPNFWYQKTFFGIPSLNLALTLYCIVFFGNVVPFSIYTVMKQSNNKRGSFKSAVSHFTPLAIATISVYAWIYSPHSLIKHSPLLFSMTIGIVFAKTATKVILAHLTHQPYPTYSRLMAPLVLGALLSRFNLFASTSTLQNTLSNGLSEKRFLSLYFACVLIAYCVWAWHVVEAFCKFLRIRCFSLKKEE